jgi:hypothetical protein
MKNISKIIVAIIAAAVLGGVVYGQINVREGGTGYAWRDSARTFVVSKTLDLSNHTSATNQVFELIQVTAPAFVSAVYWEVVSAANAGVTFEIGDGADTDGYVAARSATNISSGVSSLAITVGTNFAASVTGYTAGKYYAANDSIDVKFPGNIPTTGILKFKAVITSLED